MANLVRVIFIIMKNRSTINFQKYEKIGQKISIIEKKTNQKILLSIVITSAF